MSKLVGAPSHKTIRTCNCGKIFKPTGYKQVVCPDCRACHECGKPTRQARSQFCNMTCRLIFIRKRAALDAARQKKNRYEAEKIRKSKLYESGLCTNCGTSPRRQNRTTCEMCGQLSSQRSWNNVLRRTEDPNNCSMCGGTNPIKPLLAGSPTHRPCEICYYKQKSRFILGTMHHWETLKTKLREQNFKCTYTGEVMILGVNDSVDHILPISRFPEHRNDPSNVEWVTREVNDMKSNLTPKEFISLLEKIISYRNVATELSPQS